MLRWGWLYYRNWTSWIWNGSKHDQKKKIFVDWTSNSKHTLAAQLLVSICCSFLFLLETSFSMVLVSEHLWWFSKDFLMMIRPLQLLMVWHCKKKNDFKSSSNLYCILTLAVVLQVLVLVYWYWFLDLLLFLLQLIYPLFKNKIILFFLQCLKVLIYLLVEYKQHLELLV